MPVPRCCLRVIHRPAAMLVAALVCAAVASACDGDNPPPTATPTPGVRTVGFAGGASQATAPTEIPAPTPSPPAAPTPFPTPTPTPEPPTPTPAPAATATRAPAPPPTPTRVPPTPTPAGPPPKSFDAGEWEFNFTVVSHSCPGIPTPGTTFDFTYHFDDVRQPGDGFITDGEPVRVTHIGGTYSANVVFHWPELAFDYDIEGSHVYMVATFDSPSHGRATMTENYENDDGKSCTIYLRDAG